MIIDIGGGTSDIAVIALNGIVTSESIKFAGDSFDADLMRYVCEKYELVIGCVTAEQVKIKQSEIAAKTMKRAFFNNFIYSPIEYRVLTKRPWQGL
jgi:actin-like ATPase involved in cell morphogenesis